MGARHRLSDAKCKAAKPGRIFDGDGLLLFTKPNGRQYWMFRFTIHGNRREMGIGPYPDVKLAEARVKADEARAAVRDGKNPIKLKRDARTRAEETLPRWLDAAYEAQAPKQSRESWQGPVRLHVFPKLGKTPITEVDADDLYDALRGIWRTKEHTARVALMRTNMAIEQAAAAGLSVDLNAAQMARVRLGKRRKTKAVNFPAMPYKDVPAFVAQLPDKPAGWALELLILTAVRSANARTAHIDEFDLDARLWTIPGDKMKTEEAHVVPLSDEAVATVRRALQFARNGYLFPAQRGTEPTISKRMMPYITETLTDNKFKTHGFRTSFRTWAQEQCTDMPWEAAEAAVAHKVGGSSSRAYARSSLLDVRREMMQRWAKHVMHSAEVVALNG